MKLDFFKAVFTCQSGTGSARGEKPAVGLLGAGPDRSSQRAAGRPSKPVPGTERASAVGSVAAAGRLRRRPDPRPPSVREEGRREQTREGTTFYRRGRVFETACLCVCLCLCVRTRPHARTAEARACARASGPGRPAAATEGLAETGKRCRLRPDRGDDSTRTAAATCWEGHGPFPRSRSPRGGSDPRFQHRRGPEIPARFTARPAAGRTRGPSGGEGSAGRGAPGGRGHWRCEDFEAGNGTTEGGCSSDCCSCSPGFALSK